MTCEQDWGILLSRFVDGETTPDETAQVEQHVRDCSGCARTADLFRRNEKVLDSALAGEAFGDQVVDGVMAELRRLETPPVVAPAIESRGLWETLRSARVGMAAAAAVLVIGFAAYLALRVGNERLLRSLAESERLNRELARAAENHKAERTLLAEHIQELTLSVQDAVARSESRGPDKSIYAIVTQGKTVVVKGTFHDRERYIGFSVQRTGEDGREWTTLATNLTDPHYEDRQVSEGRTYQYQFIGHAKDGAAVATTPIRTQVPTSGRLSPETSLKVTFFACTMDMKHATFIVETSANGATQSEWFTVAPGQRIGGPAGGVDFSTNLVLDQVVWGDQTVANMAAPGTAVAITRPNRMARLRTSGARAGDPSRDLWLSAAVVIPRPAK